MNDASASLVSVCLEENMLTEYLEYSHKRIDTCSYVKSYNHVTDKILRNTFKFFFDHKLTAQENGSTFYILSKKRQYKSLGYSGPDSETIDDIDQMIENLFHEVFCESEWLARAKQDGYEDVCKQWFGRNYDMIIGDVE